MPKARQQQPRPFQRHPQASSGCIRSSTVVQCVAGTLIVAVICSIVTNYWVLIHQASSSPSSSSSSSSSHIAAGLPDPEPETTTTTNNNDKDKKNDEFRLYCMLPYVWTPTSRAKRLEILDTWGPRCDKLVFLIDPLIETDDGRHVDLRDSHNNTESLPENVVVIADMKRTWHNCTKKKQGKQVKAGECRHIWEKIWRCMVWIHQQDPDSKNYNWFTKMDWDTYVFPSNIRHFVQHQKWNGWTEHHYTGHADYHKAALVQQQFRRAGRIDNTAPVFISGALQLFSSHTFHALAETLATMPVATPHNLTQVTGDRECRDGAGLADTPTATCLQKIGVPAEHSRDEQERERVLLNAPQDQLLFNRTEQGEWWFWKGKPKTVGQMENCCSHLPMAFHSSRFKSPAQGHYYWFEHYIYGNNETTAKRFNNWRSMSMPAKNRNMTMRYFAQIRLAMGQAAEPN